MLLQYQIQVKYSPSIPDNLKHWLIFEDYEQFKSFLQVIDEFSTLQIEEEHLDVHELNNENKTSELNSKFFYHNNIQLSNNFFPKGFVPFEKLFDQNDVSKNPLSNSPEEDIEEFNVGTQEEIKNIKIFASLPKEVKNEYLYLLKAHKDVFSWSYSELKTHDTTLIEHKIPLKPEAKPFNKNLRRIDLVLLPTIEKEFKKPLDA